MSRLVHLRTQPFHNGVHPSNFFPFIANFIFTHLAQCFERRFWSCFFKYININFIWRSQFPGTKDIPYAIPLLFYIIIVPTGSENCKKQFSVILFNLHFLCQFSWSLIQWNWVQGRYKTELIEHVSSCFVLAKNVEENNRSALQPGAPVVTESHKGRAR